MQGTPFGWGVGGAGNMSLIAGLLKDLGFKKVCGVLDGNKEEEAAKLRGDFPGYRFLVIPAEDVRTKKAVPARQQVDGVLDGNGKIYEKHIEQMKRLFDNINIYFKNNDASVLDEERANV